MLLEFNNPFVLHVQLLHLPGVQPGPGLGAQPVRVLEVAGLGLCLGLLAPAVLNSHTGTNPTKKGREREKDGPKDHGPWTMENGSVT